MSQLVRVIRDRHEAERAKKQAADDFVKTATSAKRVIELRRQMMAESAMGRGREIDRALGIMSENSEEAP